MTAPARFDVCIVGCGPGGNLTAYHLARAGYQVLLLERATLPRTKPCAGGLSAKTLACLPYSVAPLVERTTERAWVSFGQQAIDFTVPGGGGMVQRPHFDAFMTRQAQAAGAELWQGCAFQGYEQEHGALRITTDHGPVEARVLVGADGANSQVRRQLYPRRTMRYAFASETFINRQLASPLKGGALIDIGVVPGGYGWIFPKGDHYNVGVYRWHKRADSRRLRALLQTFVGSQPALGGEPGSGLLSAPIPVQAVHRRLARDNVVLVGDAAGLGEALFGEGIYYALISGQRAAQAIDAYCRGQAPLNAYNRAIAPLRRQLAVNRLLARVVYRLPGFAFHRLVRHPQISGYFAGVITGRYSATQCLVYSLAHLPVLALQRRRLAPVALPH